MASFIERIEIYPERLPSGRILKHIDFRFPVFYNDQEITGIDWDNSNGVEPMAVPGFPHFPPVQYSSSISS